MRRTVATAVIALSLSTAASAQDGGRPQQPLFPEESTGVRFLYDGYLRLQLQEMNEMSGGWLSQGFIDSLASMASSAGRNFCYYAGPWCGSMLFSPEAIFDEIVTMNPQRMQSLVMGMLMAAEKTAKDNPEVMKRLIAESQAMMEHLLTMPESDRRAWVREQISRQHGMDNGNSWQHYEQQYRQDSDVGL